MSDLLIIVVEFVKCFYKLIQGVFEAALLTNINTITVYRIVMTKSPLIKMAVNVVFLLAPLHVLM